MITVLILILIFILLEKMYGNFFEKFIDTDYDFYYNGDVLIDTRNSNVSVGVGNNVDSRYAVNVGGTLFVRDKLCYGTTCLDAKMLNMLNNLPHFKEKELCLRTKDNQKVCINEEHLQLLTGQRALKLKSIKDDSRTNTKNPKYFRRHSFFQQPNHDDNDDYHYPRCGPGNADSPGNMCSHIYGVARRCFRWFGYKYCWNTGGWGRFNGYAANPIMDSRVPCMPNDPFARPADFPHLNKFVIQANPEDSGRSENFPKTPDRNFKPREFNYNCYPNT